MLEELRNKIEKMASNRENAEVFFQLNEESLNLVAEITDTLNPIVKPPRPEE